MIIPSHQHSQPGGAYRMPTNLPSRPKRARRSKTVAGYDPEELSKVIHDRCHQMAKEFDSHTGGAVLRWYPAFAAVVGFVLAFTLIYLDPGWFFFGPCFATFGLICFLLIGSDAGLEALRSRFLKWINVWPYWEYGLVAAGVITLLSLAVIYDFWGPLFMGAVIGVVTTAISYLMLIDAKRDARESIAESFATFVNRIRKYGISTYEIECGTPALMGPSWMPLFEEQFGYEVYRSTAQQLQKHDPGLLRNRRRYRDFLCDTLATSIARGRGPVGTLIDVRRKLRRQSLDQALLEGTASDKGDRPAAMPEQSAFPGNLPASEATTQGAVSPQATKDTVVELNGTGGPSSDASIDLDDGSDVFVLLNSAGEPAINRIDGLRNAGRQGHAASGDFNMHALNAENLAFHLGAATDGDSTDSPKQAAKKREYERMMEEARQSVDNVPTKRDKERKVKKYLNDEVRLSVALVFAVLFLVWVYQSGMLAESSRDELKQRVTDVSFASWSDFAQGSGRVFGWLTLAPASLSPVGVSGWGLGFACLLCGLSSLQEGWRYSVFTIPAVLVVLLGTTMSFVFSMPGVLVIGSLMIAGGLMTAGLVIKDWPK